MLLTNIFAIVTLATSAIAGYAGGHPADEGSKVSHGDDKPAHHWAAREPHEHYVAPANEGCKASNGDTKPEHHWAARKALEHAAPAHAEYKPASHDGAHVNQRRGGGVYWCTKNNWKGTCTKNPADKTCRKWGPADDGSLGPDPGVTCIFYSDKGCIGDTDVVKYPGTGSVGFIVWGKKDVVNFPQSWKCQT